MIVRSYSGRTMSEALAKVRADLGTEALIIETRTVREPGLLGKNVGIEVVAARDDADSLSGGPRQASATLASVPQAATTQAAGLARERESTSVAVSSSAPAAGIEEELAAIKRQLARLAAGQGTPTGHLGEELASTLEDAELPAEVVAELDAACAQAGERLDADRRSDFAALLLARGLPQVAPLDWTACRRLMLVGATGVGKTTTIAKLAGDLVLKRRKRVAFITIDTYRIGATDQLKAYADLLDVPLEVAATPVQLGRLLERFADFDHVLIDTAGRSPADAARVHELKGFCRAAPGIAVMLAAAATSGRAEFAAVVERFSILPLEHTVITKLDECAAAGRLYGCLRRHRLPVRFATVGQEVPEDIVQATPELFARQVVTVPEAV
jgi:flagellar biosynthesis protein FlhF